MEEEARQRAGQQDRGRCGLSRVATVDVAEVKGVLSSVPGRRERGAGVVVVDDDDGGRETRKQRKGVWGRWVQEKVCCRKHTPPRWSSRRARTVQDVEPDRSQRSPKQERAQAR